MRKRLYVTLFLLVLIIYVDAKKTSRSRSSGSGRGSSRKTSNPQPSPTSLSYPPQTAAKPSLSGWQERPAQQSQSPSRNSQPQSHSYPSSQTGLSGGSQAKQPPAYQESIQRSNVPNSHVPQQPQKTNQPSHSYPSSTGLSGNAGSGYPSQQGGGLSGSGAGYPQQQGGGLSGSGVGYPQQQGKGLSGSGVGYPQQQSGPLSGSAAHPPPYSGSNHPHNSYPQQHPTNYHGNSYNNPGGPPPPYYNNNGGYGGRGNYNPGMAPQMPGYFGNYGNNFGSMSRSGTSTLTKVGLAGAGIGTVLTGLALWNLARSTGQRHHTVVYDNRGQPVAVAPENGTVSATDPFLADLVNCSLTISNDNATEVLAIPCAIATSFRPDADLKDPNPIANSDKENTKCTITILTKSEREYMTTIPCSILLSTAAENNVTEPPPFITKGTDSFNGTMSNSDISPQPLEYTNTNVAQNNPLNCTLQSTDVQDPINPCLPVMHNLTVIPLQSNYSTTLTPESA